MRDYDAMKTNGEPDWEKLGKQVSRQDYEDLVKRHSAMRARIRFYLKMAREYRDKGQRSMELASQARLEYIGDHGNDAGLDQVPIWKGHAQDNRWYMEWSRVYDNRAQTEIMAYERGMY